MILKVKATPNNLEAKDMWLLLQYQVDNPVYVGVPFGILPHMDIVGANF